MSTHAMPEQPLALQWLCFIRDHGVDLKVTQGERALASLLPTYGQGKNIFVSMHSLAKVTGLSRNTVKKSRDGLIDKGLLEDVTGDPDKQVRTYRLTMPGYAGDASHRRILATEEGQELIPLGQELTPLGQELTPPGSESDHNIKPLDQEPDQARTSTSRADGDGIGAAEEPGSKSKADDGRAGIKDDDKDFLAKNMGVTAEAVGPSFWSWFEPFCKDDTPAFYTALETAGDIASSARSSRVGLFKNVFPQELARLTALRADEDAWFRSVEYWTGRASGRVFDDDFMPGADSFTVDDLAQASGCLPDTARAALKRLVRLADLATDDWYTFRFPADAAEAGTAPAITDDRNPWDDAPI